MEDTQKLDYFQKLKKINGEGTYGASSVQSQRQISICGSEKNSEMRNYVQRLLWQNSKAQKCLTNKLKNRYDHKQGIITKEYQKGSKNSISA